MLKIGGIYKEVNAFDKMERYFIVLKKINEMIYGYDIDIYQELISQKQVLSELKKQSPLFLQDFWTASEKTVEDIVDGYLGKVEYEMFDLLIRYLYQSDVLNEEEDW